MPADIGGIAPNTIFTAAPRRRQRRAKLFLARVPRWKTRSAVALFYWFGPVTVKFRELDSFRPSWVQMDPWAPHFVVTGSTTVTSALESGRTVIRRLLAPDFDRSGFGFDTPASPVHAYVLAFFVARNAASLSSGPAPRYCAGEPAGAGAAGVKPRTQSDSSLTSPCSLMALMRYTYCLSGSTVSSV